MVLGRDECGVGIVWDEFGEGGAAARRDAVEGCWRVEARTPSLVK